jgi:hypothetical protein
MKEKSMQRALLPGVALLVVMTGSLASADDLKSGLQIGEKTRFYVVNISTGKDAGESFCLR